MIQLTFLKISLVLAWKWDYKSESRNPDGENGAEIVFALTTEVVNAKKWIDPDTFGIKSDGINTCMECAKQRKKGYLK